MKLGTSRNFFPNWKWFRALSEFFHLSYIEWKWVIPDYSVYKKPLKKSLSDTHGRSCFLLIIEDKISREYQQCDKLGATSILVWVKKLKSYKQMNYENMYNFITTCHFRRCYHTVKSNLQPYDIVIPNVPLPPVVRTFFHTSIDFFFLCKWIVNKSWLWRISPSLWR